MYSVKLNLDKPNGDADTPIYFSITGSGLKRFRIATQISVTPQQWNFEAYQIKRSHKDAVRLNKILSDRENELTTLLLDFTARKQPIDKPSIEKGLSWSKQTVSDEKLDTLFVAFLAERGKGKADGTIVGYKQMHRVLQRYEQHTKKAFHPNHYDIKTHEAIADFCYEKLGFVDKTYDVTLQRIKTFLGWSQKNGYAMKTEKTDLAQFKRLKTITEISPLNADEIRILENAEGVFTGVLEHTRNMFLFQCYTALRFGDTKRISNSHIGNTSIHILTTKTKAGVKIPIMHQTRRILNKYRKNKKGNEPIFPQFANNVYNIYLGRVFKQLGLNRTVEEARQVRGQVTREYKPLHDVISSHDGRRTFITLSLIAGMNAWELMSITGHENFETFKKYVRFAEQETARRLCNSWQSIIPQFTVIKQPVTVINLADKMGFNLPELSPPLIDITAA